MEAINPFWNLFIIIFIICFELNSLNLVKCEPSSKQSLLTSKAHGNHHHISTTKPQIIAIGPGLQQAHLPFPIRYFFIFHQSPIWNDSTIQIRPLGSTKTEHRKNRCIVWPQILDQTQFCISFANWTNVANRSFQSLDEILDHSQYCDDEDDIVDESQPKYWLTIFRYSLYGSAKCEDPMELVIYNPGNPEDLIYRKPLQPFNIPIYSEWCDCATKQYKSDWSKQMDCDSNNNQILQQQIYQDLKPFQKDGINFTDVLAEAEERFAKFPKTFAFCHYKILNNRAHKKCYGEYVGFSQFFDNILLSLIRKTNFGDTEFLVNLGDWPLSQTNRQPALPIFSWCGSNDTNDIVLPTYELTETMLKSFDGGGHSTDILSIFGQQHVPFSRKLNKLFWRGRDSNEIRLRLIELSFQHPEWFDVAITNFFFFRNDMHKYVKDGIEPRSQYVSMLEFFNNKFQINIDGTVAAYRFPFLMAGSSLVIKQQSNYYEFFYHTFQNGKHFIEIDSQLSGLHDMLEDLIKHEKCPNLDTIDNVECSIKKMIWMARKQVLKHLLPSSIYCYYYKAIEAYSSLLDPNEILYRRPITEMQLLAADAEPTPHCDCDQTKAAIPNAQNHVPLNRSSKLEL